MMKETPNLNYIQKLSGGDKSFHDKLLGIIKMEFPQEVEVYQMNLRLKKFELAADNVHKLKHKISILGLEESYQIAEDYENGLREQELVLEQEFGNILLNISEFLNTI
ncbi:MAG: Hpt domain-containing protein [Bacteroidia bacterium]|nr:Hpt domain-containing protein [Bacteroidia bacterium]NND24784.1 Hpt domain-containing protein [Flavobacteriaceae bacterium]NNM35661.1 Hpt domain-containing protein [Nitrosopumilus sp.]MBT8279179.1 Hpt domain-containing protein [Bacteroidia bacterium]NNK60867.1 Hpt domain-containing protein [Flavobacteriaceae bacterium]